MGQQATIIIHLDALDTIAADRDFGWKFADAILRKANSDPQGDNTVTFNTYANNCSETAGVVVEVHDSNHTVTIKAGDNTGSIVKPKDRKKSIK